MGARGGAREHANSRIRGYSALWAEHISEGPGLPFRSCFGSSSAAAPQQLRSCSALPPQLLCSCSSLPPQLFLSTSAAQGHHHRALFSYQAQWKKKNPQQHEAGTGSFPPRLGSAGVGARRVRCRSSRRPAVRCVRTTADSRGGGGGGRAFCARAEEEAASFLGFRNSRERIRVII